MQYEDYVYGSVTLMGVKPYAAEGVIFWEKWFNAMGASGITRASAALIKWNGNILVMVPSVKITITWSNVAPNVYHPMPSLGHNELNQPEYVLNCIGFTGLARHCTTWGQTNCIMPFYVSSIEYITSC